VTTKETEKLLSVLAKRLELLEKGEEEHQRKRKQDPSRSRSPHRVTPSPKAKPRSQTRGTPLGFKRSSCKLNHACGNPRCYTSTTDPNIVWDKSKYAKPYVPRWYYQHK